MEASFQPTLTTTNTHTFNGFYKQAGRYGCLYKLGRHADRMGQKNVLIVNLKGVG